MNGEIIIAPTTAPLPAVEAVHGAGSDDALIDLWLHGRSRRTQAGYRSDVQRFRAWANRGLHQVTLAQLQAYSDELAGRGLQSATVRRMLAAVKSLFAFAHRIGFLPFDTAKPLKLPPVRDTLAERVIDEPLVLRMIALEPNPRNSAIVALLYGAGLRVSELVGLRWRDLIGRGNGAGQITVFGKGAKTRIVLLPSSVFGRLIALRPEDASDDAPVFLSRKRGALVPSQILRITKAAARRAGINRNVRNHDLRHSHATHAIDRGAPLQLISATLGHSQIGTTGRYLHAKPSDSSSRYLPL